MKVQFSRRVLISIYRREDYSRKFVLLEDRVSADGCVLLGEPVSFTLSNGKDPNILIYIESSQKYSLEFNKKIAYINIVGAFLTEV